MFLTLLLVVVFLVASYLLLKADANLTLLFNGHPTRGHFRNKVFWITGASSGIGESLARSLSEDGAQLVLSSRNEQQLEEMRQSLANPSMAKVLAVDLSQAETLPDKATQAWHLFGHIDVLVNNAGVSCRVPVEDVTEDLVRRMMEVDFFGQIILTQSILPHMTKRECGQIVNVSSLAGKFGMPLRAPYCAAKFALNGYMESLDLDV
jgi:short-subunit dehydrogenase